MIVTYPYNQQVRWEQRTKRQPLQTILKATSNKIVTMEKIRSNRCKIFTRGNRRALNSALTQMCSHLSPPPPLSQPTKTILNRQLLKHLRSICRSKTYHSRLTGSPLINRKKRRKFARIGRGTPANLVNSVPSPTAMKNY